MKKVIAVLFAVLFVGTTLAVAAPTKKSAGKIKNTEIKQAFQDLHFDYLGTPISVPQGQVILLGERPNGSIVIRGLNMDQIKIGPGTFSTEGYSIVSYQPETNVVYLNRGKWLTLRDPHGETATVYEKGAISAKNAKINSNTLEDLRRSAQDDAAQVSEDLSGLNDPFAEQTAVLEKAVYEQASDDVESTLSPSAPIK